MAVELQTVAPAAQPRQSSTATPPTNGDGAGQVISSDFETFLLMLTTQLENQDPLNPIESQDFAVQLATFSGVEQQVQTNDLLRNLTAALGASDLARLADWVGMEARVDAPVTFSGRPIDIAIAPDAGSDSAELIVRDAFGREVAREGLPSGGGVFPWVGTDDGGAPLPSGTYTLELASLNRGEVTSVRSVSHYAQVTEARLGADGIELVIAGGTVVSADGVSALRAPAEASE